MECNTEHCNKRFETIEKRLDSKSILLDQHNTDIGILKTELGHITNSLNALTKVLWGVAGTMVATLLSFVIWYIQTLAR